MTETAIAGMFAIETATIIAGLIGVIVTMIAVLIAGTMIAALIAMTDGVIGTIGGTNGRCTGTVTAGVTNLVQRPGPVVNDLKLTLESEKAEHIVLRLFYRSPCVCGLPMVHLAQRHNGAIQVNEDGMCAVNYVNCQILLAQSSNKGKWPASIGAD
jgi:hypothetical protein